MPAEEYEVSDTSQVSRSGSKKGAVVVIRHGRSAYNAQDRFAGWEDCPLHAVGEQEAAAAGRLLAEQLPQLFAVDRVQPCFDVAFTSALKRTRETFECIVKGMAQRPAEVLHAWQLNERHYGAWQGDQVAAVRKDHAQLVDATQHELDAVPPSMEESSEQRSVDVQQANAWGCSKVPNGETLGQARARMGAYWDEVIAPRVAAGERVLLVSHGNAIRCLLGYIGLGGSEPLVRERVPTGVPMVLEQDETGAYVGYRYLVHGDELQAAIASSGRT